MFKTKFLVLGSNGQLGKDLIKILKSRKEEFVGLTHNDIELKDYMAVRKIIKEIKPEIIINTAAFHNVDLCEENPIEAYSINSQAVYNLAEICKDNNTSLVHISTDYVFDGKKEKGFEYNEGDFPNPINVYGKSKLHGERVIKGITDKYFIVRTAALQGISQSSVKGRNFIETMMRLGNEKGLVEVVNDQFTSPTYTLELAGKIIDLSKTTEYGLYHLTSEGSCSWYEFAKEIFKRTGMNVKVIPINTREAEKKFNYKAKRPLNTVLSNNHLKQIGIANMPHWKDCLSLYLKERSKNGIEN